MAFFVLLTLCPCPANPPKCAVRRGFYTQTQRAAVNCNAYFMNFSKGLSSVGLARPVFGRAWVFGVQAERGRLVQRE